MTNSNKKIFKTEKIENNSVFNQLVQNLNWFEDLPNLNVEVIEITSSVEKNTGKWNVKIHNCITIHFPCKSYVRLSSYGTNSIEITNINVKESSRNLGTGCMLMTMLFMFLNQTLGEFPNIVLECTGNLIFDGFEFKYPLQNQIRFFRKFGFRVSYKKGYPEYVQMKLDQSKLNLMQIAVQLYSNKSGA